MKYLPSFVLNVYLLVLIIQIRQTESISNACHNTQFRCDDGSRCLNYEQLCDGNEDCPNGEDEKGNNQWDCTRWGLEKTKCDIFFEFKCHFGGCVEVKENCDGVPHCWGGTDESSNLCDNGARRPISHRVQAVHLQYFGSLHRRRTTTPSSVSKNDERHIGPGTTRATTILKHIANLHDTIHERLGITPIVQRITRPRTKPTTTTPQTYRIEEEPESLEFSLEEQFDPIPTLPSFDFGFNINQNKEKKNISESEDLKN